MLIASRSHAQLVAEWIHITLFGIILTTIKLKVYTFGGLMNSATKSGCRIEELGGRHGSVSADFLHPTTMHNCEVLSLGVHVGVIKPQVQSRLFGLKVVPVWRNCVI